MGYIGALGMAGATDERTALSWHLTANHFPPVPTSMVDACVAALDAAEAGDWDAPVTLPEGVTWRGEGTAPASAIFDAHHLGALLEARLLDA